MTGIVSRLWRRTPKVVEIPTADTQELEGLETWCVQWMARSGNHKDRADLTSVNSVCHAFTNEPDARLFELALRDAYALVKDSITTHSIRVFKM